jgi:hypothetical protein
MDYPESNNEGIERAYWYNKGRESVLRSNMSGCCCLIENDEIIEPCLLHKKWKEESEEIDLTEYNKEIGLIEKGPFK